jgi:hypothetical protein
MIMAIHIGAIKPPVPSIRQRHETGRQATNRASALAHHS